MHPGDIYYILFRHKWRIALCAVAGLTAATAVYRLLPPPYQSEALLYVRYVTEGRTPAPPGDDLRTIALDQRGETIINTEMEILTSLDLAIQVADTVGPAKILAAFGGGQDPARAASIIKRNLQVEVAPRSSVLHVSFQHPDQTVVRPVLAAVIDAYLRKHVAIHEAAGGVGEYLNQETDQLRARLVQTEDELRKARAKAGVIALDDATKAYGAQMAKIRQDIFSAEAELAESSATLAAFTNSTPVVAQPADPTQPAPPAGQSDAYRDVCAQLELLRRRERELLTQFTPESTRVRDLRAQIADAESRKSRLETEFPQLLHQSLPVAAPSGGRVSTFDPAAEAARVAALQTKIKVLNAQLAEVRADAAKADQMESTIMELRRKLALDETNYKYYAASLEQARIGEALGADRVSNISQIQTPSPPGRNWKSTMRLVAGLAVGGFAGGVGWAFLIEFFFDRSVRRPVEVERLLKYPLFLAIPRLGRSGQARRLALGPAREEPEPGRKEPDAPGAPPRRASTGSLVPSPSAGDRAALMPWFQGHAFYPFHETLRDRLIGYFENKGLTHKPKLVAVTGLGKSAGVTTIATGLAQCFSETGEGNVLLVDMTVGQGSAQQFFHGKAVQGLEEVLDEKDPAQVNSNLYVVAESSNSEKLTRVLPKRFNQLVPKLRASDFDYIIFDMPPVSQISITPRLAGFMDMMLMVVESEKTDRDLMRRAADLLAESNANVGVVLNKTKTYVPSRLEKDFLGGT